MTFPFIVVCVDDRNRPNEIPNSKWIQKGMEYTVIEATKCLSQGGALAFVLEEIDLNGYFPYIGFSAHRFRIKEDQPEKILEEEILETI